MSRCRSIATLIILTVGCAPSSESDKATVVAQPPPKVRLGDVVCLTTNWYPQTAQDEDETENRIFRELVRQGVLLAAREEMSLVTRDETLGEPFPKSPEEGETAQAEAQPLEVWLELDPDGAWHARLHGAGTTFDNPVWRHDGMVEFNKRTIYLELAQQVTKLAAEMADQLRAAGGNGQTRKLNPENKPAVEVEKRLGEMNFVSQFAAVRAAHQAMAKDGASLDWLGVLVRGYANLALLTDHTWASHSEAFAARALLYAERMMQLSQEDHLARWHRAYALAVIGAHGAAIDELAELNKNGENDLPAWIEVIEPYAEFDHDKLDAVANDHADLSETVAFLQWHLYASYQHGRWIYEKGLDAMQEIPEAYGVYSAMAGWNALRIKRMGSYAGIEAFGGLLPKRVAMLADVPESAKHHTVQRGFLSQLLGRRPDNAFSDSPIKISKALMKATTEESPSECSWAILAQLIAEEQFVMAANALKVAGDAVEHSKAGLVERLEPLVEGHGYAPYIKSFAYLPSEEYERRQTLSQIRVVDPKGNMQPLYHRTWQVSMATGDTGGLFSWRAVWGRNFTLQGMFESYYGSVASWRDSFTQEHRELFGRDFGEISPLSPNALRVPLESKRQHDPHELSKVEAKMGDDPVGWMVLGNDYYAQEMYEDSARCYKKSLEISPCMASTKGLADSYYYGGQKELWQPTLEAYLEVEDTGLAHAQIHQLIANENLGQRNWQEAEPHALEAAQTYSASGLILAGRVYEGMQDWEKSEHFIAEATRSYPSYSMGTEWYFWCRRTGRGDIDAAREYAGKSIAIASQSTRLDDIDRTLTYRMLEGDLEGGLAGYEQQMALCPDSQNPWGLVYRQLHVISICGETKDDTRKSQTIGEVRNLIADGISTTHPNWVDVLQGLCDVFDGKQPTDEFLKTFDEVLAGADTTYRCNYWYFLGVALDQQGSTELADKYLRKAAFLGSFERYNATLAGHRLVQRLGPERGGLPEEFAQIELEIAAKAKGKAEKAVKAGEDDASI